SFDHILPFPCKTRQLRVALKQLERRVYDGSALILLPVPLADRAGIGSAALLVAGRTGLRSLDALLFETTVIHDSQRVMLPPFVDAVDPGRKDVIHLGLPRRFTDLGRSRKVDLEAILSADILVP